MPNPHFHHELDFKVDHMNPRTEASPTTPKEDLHRQFRENLTAWLTEKLKQEKLNKELRESMVQSGELWNKLEANSKPGCYVITIDYIRYAVRIELDRKTTYEKILPL